MAAAESRRARAYAGLHAKAICRAAVLAGFGTALIIGVVTVMANSDEDGLRVRSTTLDRAPVADPDPLAAAFARCNGLGTAAADDAGCRAAWAANRTRFLTGRPYSASER